MGILITIISSQICVQSSKTFTKIGHISRGEKYRFLQSAQSDLFFIIIYTDDLGYPFVIKNVSSFH